MLIHLISNIMYCLYKAKWRIPKLIDPKSMYDNFNALNYFHLLKLVLISFES